MKNLILCLLLLSSCQVNTPTQQQTQITAEEEQIAKDLIQGAFDDLWAGLDSNKISKYHTNDFIILEQGEIWDNDQIKDYMRNQIAQTDRPKRTNRMEFLSIDKYGESMQIAYFNFAEFTRSDTLVGDARWLESALAVNTKDGWKLKMMHSTWAGN
jgi:hypothetical protein